MKSGFILIIRNANIIGLAPAGGRHRRQSGICTETITADRYRQQLLRLNEEIQQKHPFAGKGKRPVKLLHDNARPHVGKLVKDTLMAL